MEAYTKLINHVTNDPATILGILPVYGVMMFGGFLVAAGLSYIEWNKKGWRTYDFFWIASFGGLVALYGAKIWYLAFDPVNAFMNVDGLLDLVIIVFVPAYGRSIMGTIFFAPIGIWIWKRFWGPEYKTLDLMDTIIPYMLLAMAIGRWGNFADHNVYGSIVSEEAISWLPSWITNNMYIDGEYRNPLFLYESMVDLTLFIIIWLGFKTNSYFKDGVACFTTIGAYGLARTFFEPFRDSQFIMHWGPLPTSWILAIIFATAGFSVAAYLQWFRKD